MCAYIGATSALVRWLSGRRSVLSRRIPLTLVAAAALAGCSVHPLPDDVTGIPTEEIVRSARCEMQLGLFDQVKWLLEARGVRNFDIKDLQTKERRNRFLANPPRAVVSILEDYGKVGVAYDFDFDITEADDASANLAFQLPWSASKLDLASGTAIMRIRRGKRTFSAQETFEELMQRDWCEDFVPRERNLRYPIAGSIGLRKVVETFIRLSQQGGGKDNFVDKLDFTTTVSAGLQPSITLNAVPGSFRLVRGTMGLSAERTDLHKITVSLAFPTPSRKREKKKYDLTIDDTFEFNPVWRARYNLCVADARDREDTLKTLRDSPPEVYCMEYADAFVRKRYAEGPPATPESRKRAPERSNGRGDEGGAGAPPPSGAQPRSLAPPPEPRVLRRPSWW
jgi:hypothetical protein